MDGYQTLDKCLKKLESLQLPEDLSGASVLDVGCNEGFFCIEAKRRGATTVIGIDDKSKNTEKAIQQSSGIDFLCQNWDDPLPEGPFDYILHLSAFHYAKNPQKLLDDMRGALAPEGVLILQIGIDQTSPKKEWVKPSIRPDNCVHPSKILLEEELLNNFSFRFVGNSVQQAGDSTPRFVYHCYHKSPAANKDTNIVLIGGVPDSGKTTLAKSLMSLPETHTHFLSLDALTLIFLKSRPDIPLSPHRNLTNSAINISSVYGSLNDGQVLSFADTIFQHLENLFLNPLSDVYPFSSIPRWPVLNETVVVEGYFISFHQNFANEFLKRGYANILSIHMEKSKEGQYKALIGSDEYDVTNGSYTDVLNIVENMGNNE